MNGNGLMTWPDGRSYQGQFKDDKKHGVGTYIWKGRKYVGEWNNGQQHGIGKYFNDAGLSRDG